MAEGTLEQVRAAGRGRGLGALPARGPRGTLQGPLRTCAGSSPHPSLAEEEEGQTELLVAEEKLSPEQEGQLMPRWVCTRLRSQAAAVRGLAGGRPAHSLPPSSSPRRA